MRHRVWSTVLIVLFGLHDARVLAAESSADDAGIAGLQQRMTAGELSAHALVQRYLDRIAAIDRAVSILFQLF